MLGDALRKMQKIISDILSLQRIEVMHERANYEALNLRALVLALIDSNTGIATGKNIALKCQVPRKAVMVRADSAQLREAIDNLISNAIKYTPEGGQVTVTLQQERERVTLDVTDTGYGIPEAVQGRIFQPFFRAKSPQTRHIEGTGLGLHLVKNIIERHMGKMHFESAPGVGSTFGFWLPLMPKESPRSTKSHKRGD
jgi:two-component system sensor histidine kinase VicK